MAAADLRDFECALAIVEHRHFGRAAEALGMAQPPLSRRIAALERRLGVALFSRAKRQIEVTDAGRVFAREARAVLAQVALAEDLTRGAAAGYRDRLRLGFVGSSGFGIVPAAVRAFRADYPRTVVTLTELLGARLIAALRAGTIDVAVVRGPFERDGLRGTRLRSDPLVAALPATHPLARRKTVAVSDLRDEPFVEFGRYGATGVHDLVRGVCAEAGFVPGTVQEADALDTLVACVAAGIGVALVHDVARGLPIDGVAYRPIRPFSTPVDLWAVRRRDDATPLAASFVEHLAAAALAA
jgi:DNA-binding transcriptional LysR family regulator